MKNMLQHDTTANTLSWCCYELCRNPDIQDRVREEVLANITSPNQSIRWGTLESLPLLNGVCEEAIRLYPTVPITFREAFADATVAGHHIPKGTHVAISPYAVNRSFEFWGPTADQFRPDRWVNVDKNGDRTFDRNGGATSHFGVITFLHGPRTCVGKDFARIEMRCALAGLVGQFKLELQDPTKEVLLGGGLTTKPVGGMNLKLTKLDW
jgi:cytochrome P450